jgi:hypothetical protein
VRSTHTRTVVCLGSDGSAGGDGDCMEAAPADRDECPATQACEEIIGAVKATLHLGNDIDDIPAGSEARHSFEFSFKVDVAIALGDIGAERVVIESVAGGSVVVVFFVLPGADGTAGEKGAKLVQMLGHLQPFLAVLPHECMGQLTPFGPT